MGEGGGGAGTIATADPIDPATLPDLATLGADSDFTPFLRPGVPAPLRTAALRKLWTSDPAILNYRTLADYDWDFNAPGYGSLLPLDDVKRLVDLAVGELRAADRDSAAAVADAAAPPVEAPPAGTPPAGTRADEAADAAPAADGRADDGIVLPVVAVAPDPVPAPAGVPRRRRHGGAAPD